jgi:hypothetical protein
MRFLYEFDGCGTRPAAEAAMAIDQNECFELPHRRDHEFTL